MVDTYLDTGVGITNDFLSVNLADLLRKHLLSLFQEGEFFQAGIGNNDVKRLEAVTRSDKIYWLDKAHNHEVENQFFELMDRFVVFLNQTCYTGITGYEFHYAMYEKGSFYKKHLDQFKNDSGRAFSVIMYLNEHWQEGDGGELCVYHAGHTQTISPPTGKCVFFKSSELEHEVLLSHAPRMSITGWLKT